MAHLNALLAAAPTNADVIAILSDTTASTNLALTDLNLIDGSTVAAVSDVVTILNAS